MSGGVLSPGNPSPGESRQRHFKATCLRKPFLRALLKDVLQESKGQTKEEQDVDPGRSSPAGRRRERSG